MSKSYSYPCGCSFEIIDDDQSNSPSPHLIFDPNIEKLNLDCNRTWDLICSGNTRGCFQLESNLGQSIARKLKPRNIEHLSALIALIRPSCLEAMRNKKSVTMHYIDRKNGKEEIDYFHPALKDILNKTYGECAYQEDNLAIAKKIAGFTLQEADSLRSAIGKKKADKMAELKDKFINGCKTVGIVNDEEAIQLFEWIEKAQRYQFCHAHSISYALNAYLSAYTKAHFPRAFFTSYLKYSKEKQKPFDEIRALVQNARLMGIEVCNPDFRQLNKHFRLIDKKIYFGFFDVKGIGGSVYKKIIEKKESVSKQLSKEVGQWSWLDFLVCFAPHINTTAVSSIINSGSISYMGLTRTQMEYEHKLYDKLSDRERKWVECYLSGKNTIQLTLKDVLLLIVSMDTGKNMPCHTATRKKIIESLLKTLINPLYNMNDTPAWLSSIEESLLGIPLTCTSIESCDISEANCTCAEFLQDKTPNVILIAAQIDSFNEIKTKTGKTKGSKMAFLRISDISGSLENVVAFPDVWSEVKKIVFDGNNVMLSGTKGRDGAFIVKNMFQI